MPYKIDKKKCKQSDGDAGTHVLSYTDGKGKDHDNCHTSKKGAQGQIAAIEGDNLAETDEDTMDEVLIREYIREKLLNQLMLTEKRRSKPGKFGSSQRGVIAEWVATLIYNGTVTEAELDAALSTDQYPRELSELLVSAIDSSPPNAFTTPLEAKDEIMNYEMDIGVDAGGNLPAVQEAVNDGKAMAEAMAEKFSGGVAQHAGKQGTEAVGVADIVMLNTKDKDGGTAIPRAGLSLKIGSSDPTQMNTSPNTLLSMPPIDATELNGRITTILQVMSAFLGNHEGKTYEVAEGYESAQYPGRPDIQKIIKEMFTGDEGERKTFNDIVPTEIVDGTEGTATPPEVSLASEARNTKVIGVPDAAVVDMVNFATSQFWQSRLDANTMLAGLNGYLAHFEDMGDFGERGFNLYTLHPQDGLVHVGGDKNPNNPRQNIADAVEKGAAAIGVTSSEKGIKLYNIADGGKYLLSIGFREKARADAKINKAESPNKDATPITSYVATEIPMAMNVALADSLGAGGDPETVEALEELIKQLQGQIKPSVISAMTPKKKFESLKSSLEQRATKPSLSELYKIMYKTDPPANFDITELQAAIGNWVGEKIGDDPRFALDWAEETNYATALRGVMRADGEKLITKTITTKKLLMQIMLAANPELPYSSSAGSNLSKEEVKEAVAAMGDPATNEFVQKFLEMVTGGKQKANCGSRTCVEAMPDLWAAGSRDLLKWLFGDATDAGWAKVIFTGMTRPKDVESFDPLLPAEKAPSTIDWIKQVIYRVEDVNERNALLQEFFAQFLEPNALAANFPPQLPAEPEAAVGEVTDESLDSEGDEPLSDELTQQLVNDPEINPEASETSSSRAARRGTNPVIAENNLRLMIRQHLMEDLTRADRKEIERMFKRSLTKADTRKILNKEIEKTTAKMIKKELDSTDTRKMIDKSFKKQFDKELQTALGSSFFGTPGKINKFVIDEIHNEVEKMLGNAATRELVVQICKDVIIKLYRELSFSYQPVIQRLKV